MVVAQLAEWLFPTPEDPGSNLDIIIFMKNMELLLTIYKRIKKRPGFIHFKKRWATGKNYRTAVGYV